MHRGIRPYGEGSGQRSGQWAARRRSTHGGLNPAAVPGTTPAPLPENLTVSSNDPSGYTLSVHRTAFAPHDLPLGIGVGSGGLVAIPIEPASDLALAGTSGPSSSSLIILQTIICWRMHDTASITGVDIWHRRRDIRVSCGLIHWHWLVLDGRPCDRCGFTRAL